MKIRKYINWNTLSYDSWISARFYILPSLAIFFDKNSISGEEYIKEVSISFDWLCLTFTLYFRWSEHKNLI